MSHIIDMLNTTLREKGVVPIEMTQLLQDVANVISKERYFTLAGLKRVLEGHGWERHVLDNYVLKLILLYFEGDNSFECRRYTVH